MCPCSVGGLLPLQPPQTARPGPMIGQRAPARATGSPPMATGGGRIDWPSLRPLGPAAGASTTASPQPSSAGLKVTQHVLGETPVASDPAEAADDR